jgi:hypothetical protein
MTVARKASQLVLVAMLLAITAWGDLPALPEGNATYLANTKLVVAEPISPDTKGIMLLASFLKFVGGPAAQAGNAAFQMSGGQEAESLANKYVSTQGTSLLKSTGAETELGVGYFLYHTYSTQNLSVPLLRGISLSATPNSCTFNLRLELK